jgi:hypothetical protein
MINVVFNKGNWSGDYAHATIGKDIAFNSDFILTIDGVDHDNTGYNAIYHISAYETHDDYHCHGNMQPIATVTVYDTATWYAYDERFRYHAIGVLTRESRNKFISVFQYLYNIW